MPRMYPVSVYQNAILVAGLIFQNAIVVSNNLLRDDIICIARHKDVMDSHAYQFLDRQRQDQVTISFTSVFGAYAISHMPPIKDIRLVKIMT